MQRNSRPVPILMTYCAVLLQLYLPSAAHSEDGPLRSRSSTANASILGGSIGMRLLVEVIPNRAADPANYAGYTANAIDRWWRARLHGGREPKSNFLDRSGGTLVTPVAGGLAIAALDVKRREFSRDIPLFLAGAVTTSTFTGAMKRLVTRPRPYCQDVSLMPQNRSPSDPYHTESFFSGHASQAFFTAGFVNNRLRRHMRLEWTIDEYRSWRWAPPLVCYAWATVVGLSRIHADKHHFTDVCVGALAGYAVSELFYRLCYETGQRDAATGMSAPILTWRTTF